LCHASERSAHTENDGIGGEILKAEVIEKDSGLSVDVGTKVNGVKVGIGLLWILCLAVFFENAGCDLGDLVDQFECLVLSDVGSFIAKFI
jgi:hypothetical protein